MIETIEIIKRKPSDNLTLMLLPPKQQEEVTHEDIKNFYKNLTCILMSEH